MEIKNIEDLWREYPLEFVEYKREWGWNYTDEERRILEYIEEEGIDGFIRIAHIGSTAVVGMKAKPVIDILFEIKKDTDMERLISNFRDLGYNMINYPEGREPNIMGYKGYDDEQIFHLYIRYLKKWDELYFRDHLNRNGGTREDYEKLKIELYKKFKDNREEYEMGKREFIRKCVEKEKQEYEDYLKQLNSGQE